MNLNYWGCTVSIEDGFISSPATLLDLTKDEIARCCKFGVVNANIGLRTHLPTTMLLEICDRVAFTDCEMSQLAHFEYFHYRGAARQQTHCRFGHCNPDAVISPSDLVAAIDILKSFKKRRPTGQYHDSFLDYFYPYRRRCVHRLPLDEYGMLSCECGRHFGRQQGEENPEGEQGRVVAAVVGRGGAAGSRPAAAPPNQ
jgi:hypothetical protein